ncbi:hypothetical protein Tco_1340254, partial [Tanacetum coccineum]
EVNQVETLDCSVVKLATSPRRPTTSRRGGGGGAYASVGAGISEATSLAA